MGDTFGGEHHRPTNPQRGHTRRELEDHASFDNAPQTSYNGCLLIALILAMTAAAGLALT